MLVLGGGGYTMRNVSRCWAFETARLQGVDPADECAFLAATRLLASHIAVSACACSWQVFQACR